jgi:DNA invertase Pin-like site-specific DNA recombinase
VTATVAAESRRVVAPGDSRPAAGYDRISKIKVRATGATITVDVERQWADNQECGDGFGLAMVRYSDPDRSASEFATKVREDFERLLVDVTAGRYSAVVVWLVDRVLRQTDDVTRLMRACRKGGAVLIQSGSGTVVQPDDPDAVGMLKIGAVFAEIEVAKTSKRVRRAMRSIRESGAPHPGRRRFGFVPGMVVTDATTDAEVAQAAAEAAEIHKLAAGLLAGQSLYKLCQDLNARGVVGPSGAAFTGPNLRNLMRRPHLAGYRTHGGDIVGDGTWDPILDRPTWHAVKALLDDPSRRTSHNTARRYLLTGLARCGECNQVLRARSQGTRGLAPAYVCATTSHVSRDVANVDNLVIGAVAQVLSEIDGTGTPLRPDPEDRGGAIRHRLAVLAANLDDLGVDKALGKIPQRTFDKAAAAVAKESAALDRELGDLDVANAAPKAALEGLTGHPRESCESLFLGLPLGRQRLVIATLVTVHVDKAARRGAEFDPDAIRVERIV